MMKPTYAAVALVFCWLVWPGCQDGDGSYNPHPDMAQTTDVASDLQRAADLNVDSGTPDCCPEVAETGEQGETTEVVEPDICVPACDGKDCGADGCEGSCGKCIPPACMTGWCSATGTCTFQPDEDDMVCDDDDECTPPGLCKAGECMFDLPDEICGDDVDNNCDGQTDEGCE